MRTIAYLSSILFGVLMLFSGEARADLKVKLGSFSQPASTGNQSITGVGFQPKIVLFWMNDLTADGSAANIQYAVGAATSSNQFLFAVSAVNGSGNYTPTRRHTASKCIGTVTVGAATSTSEASLVSMDSDGFTLNWSTADATARAVNYLALGGSDITNAYIGNFTTPTSTGNQSITGTGFKPDSLIFFATGGVAAPPALETGTGRPDISFATSSSSFGGSATFYTNGISTSNNYQRTSKTALSITATSPAEADLVSMDNDGFTLNWTFVYTTSALYDYYIALKGARYAFGSFNQPASTGNQFVTGTGFRPSAVILSSVNEVSSSSKGTGAKLSTGVAVSSNERFAIHISGSDGGTTSASQDLDRTKAIKMMTQGGGSPTTQAAADFVSTTIDGFTLNWTTADATAREILYFAIGPVSESAFMQLFDN
jgi:hypothetical protein